MWLLTGQGGCGNCGPELRVTTAALHSAASTSQLQPLRLALQPASRYQFQHPAMNLLCALARSLFQITDSPKFYATSLVGLQGLVG